MQLQTVQPDGEMLAASMPGTRSAASYELELALCRGTEAGLRDILAKGEALLRLKDEAIEYQALMRKESDHRLLNDMQIVVSLLALQGRASGNADISAQLLVAANRVNMMRTHPPAPAWAGRHADSGFPEVSRRILRRIFSAPVVARSG